MSTIKLLIKTGIKYESAASLADTSKISSINNDNHIATSNIIAGSTTLYEIILSNAYTAKFK